MPRCPKCRSHVEMAPEQRSVTCGQCGAALRRRRSEDERGHKEEPIPVLEPWEESAGGSEKKELAQCPECEVFFEVGSHQCNVSCPRCGAVVLKTVKNRGSKVAKKKSDSTAKRTSGGKQRREPLTAAEGGLVLLCPNERCGRRLRVPAVRHRLKIRCPDCGTTFEHDPRGRGPSLGKRLKVFSRRRPIVTFGAILVLIIVVFMVLERQRQTEKPNEATQASRGLGSGVRTGKDRVSPAPDGVQVSFLQEMSERILPSVVLIVTGETEEAPPGCGTGFVVESNGVIATCLHVIENSGAAHVRFHDGKTARIKSVLAKNELCDLALIEVEAANLPPLTLAGRQQGIIGERIALFGNPEGYGFTAFEGTVSNPSLRHEFKEGFATSLGMMAQAPVYGGCSGGPLLNRSGEVLGVIAQRDPNQPTIFAVRAEAVRDLLASPRKAVPLGPGLPVTISLSNAADKRMARRLIDQGYTSEALKLLSQVAERDARDVDVWPLLGQCFFSEQDYKEADRCYRAGVSNAPESVVASLAYAFFLLDRERYSEALQNIEAIKAYAKGPEESAWVELCLGMVLLGKRDGAGAINHLVNARAGLPEEEGPASGLALAYVAIGEPESAGVIARAGLKNFPDSADLQYALCWAYFEAADAAKFHEALNRLRELSPEYAAGFEDME